MELSLPELGVRRSVVVRIPIEAVQVGGFGLGFALGLKKRGLERAEKETGGESRTRGGLSDPVAGSNCVCLVTLGWALVLPLLPASPLGAATSSSGSESEDAI